MCTGTAVVACSSYFEFSDSRLCDGGPSKPNLLKEVFSEVSQIFRSFQFREQKLLILKKTSRKIRSFFRESSLRSLVR